MTLIRYDLTRLQHVPEKIGSLSSVCSEPIRARATLSSTIDRMCSVRLIERSAESAWLYESLFSVASEMNQQYGYAIDGIEEPLHWITYRRGEHVGWHLDTGQEVAARRKISISVQLSHASEYVGGDLEFPDGVFHPFARDRGTAIIFPSFMYHRVSPIESGVRSALVAWISGPAFV